jgi:mono/diheme cytochrome c family protein
LKISEYFVPIAVGGFLLLGVGLFVAPLISPKGAASVAVTEPTLSAQATSGKGAFDANCASCHGKKAAGTKQGPPLIHTIYNPGHHADEAFFRAVKGGVRQHHWPFGNMPPRPGVSDQQIAAIVKYVREMQVANGIKTRPHNM